MNVCGRPATGIGVGSAVGGRRGFLFSNLFGPRLYCSIVRISWKL